MKTIGMYTCMYHLKNTIFKDMWSMLCCRELKGFFWSNFYEIVTALKQVKPVFLIVIWLVTKAIYFQNCKTLNVHLPGVQKS